jgi:hypothetical protein
MKKRLMQKNEFSKESFDGAARISWLAIDVLAGWRRLASLGMRNPL